MKKQSKLSILLYVVFEQSAFEVFRIDYIEAYCKNWFHSHSFSEIEELADDLGYWLDTGNPEEDIEKAKQKILSLTNWFEKTYYTKVNKPHIRYLFDSIIASNFILKTKIKLLLHAFVHYKNPKVVTKYFKKITSFDIYKIEEEIIRLLKEKRFHSLGLDYIQGLGQLGAFLNYYYENEYYFHIFVETELINIAKNQQNANSI